MKILVLGANGQVGSELRSALNRSTQKGKGQPQITFCGRTDLDLRNHSKISHYLERVAPDIIINAAAYTAVDAAESHSSLAFLINATAVRELALFCKRRRSYLIHLSTDYVFDGSSSRPYLEEDAVGPAGVYGASKLAGERVIRDVLDHHIILRTSWVFGATGSNFVKTMLRLAVERDELAVVADQCGAPTSARAIAQTITDIFWQITSEPRIDQPWGIYHFSGFPFVSWAQFAGEIFEQARSRGLISSVPNVRDITTSEYATSATRPANSRLDCSKLKTTFGIEPDDWKTSLGLVLDELKEGMRN